MDDMDQSRAIGRALRGPSLHAGLASEDLAGGAAGSPKAGCESDVFSDQDARDESYT